MLSSILNHKYYVILALNLCMLCIAWINWHGVTQIFETPENINSYRWLKAVKQEPKLTTFKRSKLPQGEILRPEQIYAIAKDLAHTPEKVNAINTYFKHHYLTNYEALNSVNYLSGNYRITNIKSLTKDDWVTQGLAIDIHAIELIHHELNSSWMDYPLKATLLLPHVNRDDFQLEVGADIEFSSSQAISIIHLTIPVLNPNQSSIIANFIPRIVVIPLGQHLNLTGQTKLISIKPVQEVNIQAL